uniref:Uncharacterized protein n=1 Tax=Cucumis melo TaxID=3656 RepID=A0A9I9ELH3_CUCME
MLRRFQKVDLLGVNVGYICFEKLSLESPFFKKYRFVDSSVYGIVEINILVHDRLYPSMLKTPRSITSTWLKLYIKFKSSVESTGVVRGERCRLHAVFRSKLADRSERIGPNEPEKMYRVERLKKLEATVFEGSLNLADAKV